MRKLLIMLGVPIDDVTMEEALDRLEALVEEGRVTGKSHQVATVNADFVVKAMQDPELRGILQEVDMATADGMPLVWGARALGIPLQGRVTGADLVPALAHRAAERGYSLYLLGAAPGVAERAAEVLCAQHPALRIVGIASPFYRSVLQEDEQTIADIRQARPDILLVAFGNPKQEKWIHMHARTLGVPVCIGVGGTFDFIAGTVRRAPAWMQKSGLEWLYRLLQEPRRLWRRYVIDLIGFGFFFVRQWWAMRSGHTPETQLPKNDTLLVSGMAIIRVRGRLDAANRQAFAEQLEQALAATPRLVLDLSQADFLDSAALGTLVGMAKRAREAGGDLILAAASPSIARILALIRLDRFFVLAEDVAEAQHQSRKQSTPSPKPAQSLGRWTVLQMPRRVDSSTAPQIVEHAKAALVEKPHLVLDFSGTVFIASAGLAALLRLDRQARAAGGELRLAGCIDDVLQVIRMIKLDMVFRLFPDVFSAINGPSA